MSPEISELIAVGAVVSAHGINGNVKVKPLTDYPGRFKELSLVHVELKDKSVIPLNIREVKVNDEYIIINFNEIVDRNQAEPLKGGVICIKEQELLPLSDEAFYQFEVMGFEVKTTDGQLLGKVTEIIDLASNDVLVVKNSNKEFLIPLIKDVVKKVDRGKKEFIIEPIDGLLDL